MGSPTVSPWTSGLCTQSLKPAFLLLQKWFIGVLRQSSLSAWIAFEVAQNGLSHVLGGFGTHAFPNCFYLFHS